MRGRSASGNAVAARAEGQKSPGRPRRRRADFGRIVAEIRPASAPLPPFLRFQGAGAEEWGKSSAGGVPPACRARALFDPGEVAGSRQGKTPTHETTRLQAEAHSALTPAGGSARRGGGLRLSSHCGSLGAEVALHRGKASGVRAIGR